MTYQIEQPDIDDLKGSEKNEHKIAIFASRLMHGVEIDGRWFRIEKMNSQKYKDDPNRFEVDFGIACDGEVVGYLDPEEKIGWKFDGWAYPRVNIPLYPFGHWERGRFNGHHTVKLRRFSQKPDLSYWLGARIDYKAYVVVPFMTMIEHGTETKQPTRYDAPDLPVIAVPNEHCIFLDSEDAFVDYFVKEFKAWTS